MPTIGQCKSFLAGFDLVFALAGFDRDDFVLLRFLRPRGAALLILRLTGIALVMLAMPPASYKMRIGTKAVCDRQRRDTRADNFQINL